MTGVQAALPEPHASMRLERQIQKCLVIKTACLIRSNRANIFETFFKPNSYSGCIPFNEGVGNSSDFSRPFFYFEIL
jgi:hypothetical protein